MRNKEQFKNLVYDKYEQHKQERKRTVTLLITVCLCFAIIVPSVCVYFLRNTEDSTGYVSSDFVLNVSEHSQFEYTSFSTEATVSTGNGSQVTGSDILYPDSSASQDFLPPSDNADIIFTSLEQLKSFVTETNDENFIPGVFMEGGYISESITPEKAVDLAHKISLLTLPFTLHQSEEAKCFEAHYTESSNSFQIKYSFNGIDYIFRFTLDYTQVTNPNYNATPPFCALNIDGTEITLFKVDSNRVEGSYIKDSVLTQITVVGSSIPSTAFESFRFGRISD